MTNSQLTISSMVVFAIFGVAHAERALPRAVKLNIESQPLDKAINAWSEQTGYQVLIPAGREVSSRAAPIVQGTYTPEGALKVLLASTDLKYQFVNPHTVAIRASDTSKSSQALAPTSGAGERTARSDSRISLASNTDELGASRASQSDDGHNAGPRDIQQVVVTGTYLRGVAPVGAPITTYTRQEIERTGAGTVEQFARTIPQNLSSADASTARASGVANDVKNVFNGAGVNLRGLGSSGTLVLLNGHRLAPGGQDGSFVDISMIPLSAVDRVEVLTEGASAVYGSDAVAGVINFVLRDHYDGAETSLRYADPTRGGAEERSASQLLGTSWQTGSAFLNYEYRREDSLRAGERSFIPLTQFSSANNVTPEQSRNSVYLSAHQKIFGKTGLFADGFYSDRDYVLDAVNVFSVSRSTGKSRQYGGTVGAGYSISPKWQAELVGSYSRIDQSDASVFKTFGTIRSAARSQIESVDAHADGALAKVSAGDLRASVGVGARREVYTAAPNLAGRGGADLSRDVLSAYGEVLVPLLGDQSRPTDSQRLQLSLASRYDRYNDFGSSFNPKVGISWAPISALTLRSTYARSYRAPSLSSLNDTTTRLYQVITLPDPSSPTQRTTTLLNLTSGNSALDPERSRSLTFGFDIAPQGIPRLQLSGTYFHIDFRNRIATPPLTSFLDIYTQPALVPFLTRSPSVDTVQAIFNQGNVVNTVPPTPASAIGAVFDFQPQNLALSKASGVDVAIRYGSDTRVGDLGVYLDGTYLRTLSFQPTSLTSTVDLINKPYHPPHFRLHTGLNWSLGSLSSSVALAYAGSYDNTLIIPTGHVASWLTADWQIAYRTSPNAPALLEGLFATVSVLNITDKDPPFLQSGPGGAGLGYDPSNASALGRVVALQVSKHW